MADFLIELFGSLLDAAVPPRAQRILVALIVGIAGTAFGAFSGFILYQIFVAGAEPLVGLIALLFAALSAYCFKLMLKGFRAKGARPR